MNFLTPDWPAPINVKAYTTLRQGWGDDPNLPASRKKLQSLLNLPSNPIWLTQTHSTTVLEASSQNIDQIGDASFTNQPQHICTILTADCMPILICNQSGTHVAAIHAGWRGLAGGIIENTLQALDLPTKELLVWLGPSIGPSQFEVGADVYSAFTTHHPSASTAFTPLSEGKWLANLYQLATLRLQEKGVDRLYGGDFCTYTQEDLFFSFRRDKGHAGRMASLIWLS